MKVVEIVGKCGKFGEIIFSPSNQLSLPIILFPLFFLRCLLLQNLSSDVNLVLSVDGRVSDPPVMCSTVDVSIMGKCVRFCDSILS